MNEKKPISKSLAAVSLALAVALLLIAAVFVFGKKDDGRAEIVLPEAQSQTSTPELVKPAQEESLLQITTENAVLALSSLERPRSYMQTYRVQVGREDAAAVSTVELWVSGKYKRAQITTSSHTKILVTDGVGAWLWYSHAGTPRRVTLSENLSFEDLIGLPAFDYLQTLQSEVVTEAEYLVLENEQKQTPCIFLSTQGTDNSQIRYWVDLQTGLLCEADCMEGNSLVYLVEEQAFDLLADGDEVLSDKFLLPDGTSVVIGETDTLPQQ